MKMKTATCCLLDYVNELDIAIPISFCSFQLTHFILGEAPRLTDTEQKPFSLGYLDNTGI